MNIRFPSWASIKAFLELSLSSSDLGERKDSAAYANNLIAIREGRGTRYAATASVSQQKARRLARRVKPHGWKGGAK